MKFKERFKNIEYNNLYPLFFTIIFILILIQYSFNSLDAIFYDLWSKADIVANEPDNIVVVTMDEESDQFLGEVYPYTYATHVRFLDKLLDDRPDIVSYLIPFLAPETQAETSYAETFHDRLLKYSQEEGHFRFGTDKDAWGEQVPPENLVDLGYSLALINKDGNVFAKDDVTRRVILNISGEDSLHLWIANKYQESRGLEKLEAAEYQGAYYNREADATFSLFRYGGDPSRYDTVTSIAFHRVVVGNFPRGFFKGKTVLIGSQYLSNVGDFVNTPFGKEDQKSPKLNVHAQIIQSLIKDMTVVRAPDWITDFIAIILAILLPFIISKVKPTKGILITMAIMVSMFSLAYFSYIGLGIWFKLSHVILSIFVVYYIWVPFRAIGEYQTRYTIQEETKMLKKVDMLKQNFISLMSHDLKTPVAKISGIADILRNQYRNEPKQKELLDNIVLSTKELNNFITSILDLTKIESRDITLRLETKDINPLIEQTVDKLKFEASAQNMKINMDLAPLYPIKLDVVLINRVLANLIGNAIKYAGQGSEVSVRSWDDEQWVYVEIKDSGKGIKEEDLEYIFDKFYRVKNDDSHKIKGSGLGLYLVKYFIELHHGKIAVTSKPNEGAAFLIQLKNE
ncbi:MAG: CHASE2 domain-containing protein [Bacteriovoracaceae bacterium]|nr:CHASE2 domain-containing protein [Bacteriovoracaceae bacterium]